MSLIHDVNNNISKASSPWTIPCVACLYRDHMVNKILNKTTCIDKCVYYNKTSRDTREVFNVRSVMSNIHSLYYKVHGPSDELPIHNTCPMFINKNILNSSNSTILIIGTVL